jgi:dihydrofolate reductase
MRKLRIIAHISLDGVIQHDAADGFAHGDWTTPYRSPVGLAAVVEAQGTPFELLLGRRTYDAWASYWPTAGDSAVAKGLNAATKYVATHRPESLAWGPVEHLGPDVLAGIRRLKATAGPDLIVWGSTTLTSGLLGEGLVDEVVLLVYPVLLGQGKRFFLAAADPRALTLVSTQVTPTGVLLNKYRYSGPLRT